jgi:hypothetical protein
MRLAVPQEQTDPRPTYPALMSTKQDAAPSVHCACSCAIVLRVHGPRAQKFRAANSLSAHNRQVGISWIIQRRLVHCVIFVPSCAANLFDFLLITCAPLDKKMIRTRCASRGDSLMLITATTFGSVITLASGFVEEKEDCQD